MNGALVGKERGRSLIEEKSVRRSVSSHSLPRLGDVMVKEVGTCPPLPFAHLLVTLARGNKWRMLILVPLKCDPKM